MKVSDTVHEEREEERQKSINEESIVLAALKRPSP